MSFLKKYFITIFLIVIFLAIQAIGIITIPVYIANLVDIGISRYGIESSVPKAIRKQEMNKLLIFMNRDKTVLDNFKQENDIYYLKENVDEKALNYKFARAETLLLIINKDESILNLREKVKTNVTSQIKSLIGTNNNIINFMSILNQNDLALANDAIDEKLQVLTEDMLMQISAKYIIEEYNAIGIENPQMNYILKTGAEMLFVALLVFVSTCIGKYIMLKFSAEVAANYREKIFNKCINMKEDILEKFSITALINRTVYDINTIQNAIPVLFSVSVTLPIITVGSLIKIRQMGSKFSITLVVVGAIILIIGFGLFKSVFGKERKMRSLVDKINLVLRDSLNNLFIIKTRRKRKTIKKIYSY